MVNPGPLQEANDHTLILRQFPHYNNALSISNIDADSLTYDVFYKEFINQLRPVLIKGAVRHWPAFQKWRSKEYVLQKVGNPRVKATLSPKIESEVALKKNPNIKEEIEECNFDDFMSALYTKPGHRVLHGYQFAATSPLRGLGDDVTGFRFLDNVRQPRMYPRSRAFFYRDSYTDWHYHMADETLMCQVFGSKETLLLPPDKATYEILHEIIDTVGRGYSVDCNRFPRFADIGCPYRVVVEPGDALYIPTFWWHSVESPPNEVGLTLAWCWATPIHLFDPRLRGVQMMLRDSLLSRAGVLQGAAALWSILVGIAGRFRRPPFSV